MAKVSNVMATKVALDMVDASTSVRNLTTLVNSATQAWKANVAELRSAGDYAGAAKAKYDGLGDAISAQRNKIEALERKQSEMNNIDKQTADRYMELRSKLNQYREEQDKLDTTTKQGEERYKQLNEQIDAVKGQLDKLDTGTVKSAEQFLRYGQQVDRAKAKLAGLEAQRQRAAQTMELENSGVLKLNATMRTQGALATATAERLRSEGKNYQAMGVEVNNLRSRLETLRTIQSRETELLESTRNRMGEASDAYMKQATHVEELGTKIQETRQKLNQLNDAMKNTPHGWLGGLQSRLDAIQGRADRVSNTFGRMFVANAAANIFSNTLGAIQGRLADLTKAGFDYNVEQNKMNATWTTLTGSAKKAGPMVDSINSMSKATGQSVDVVNELEQGFYHLHSSKSQADGLTSSMLNMADAVGLNGDQIKAVEQDMVHGMATGKITQGELNQIGQYFPMIDERMAKHFHTTVAGMRQMAKAGKITSKDLQDVFEQMGNGNGKNSYKKSVQNMMNSYFGIFRTIRARAPQLAGDISAPFMKMSNPFLQSIRRWINDKSTDTEFRRLGNQMARSMNQIISAFGGSNVSATKVMDGAIRNLTAGVRQFGDIVASHHTQIANFFHAFKEGSAAQAKLFAAVFMDLSKVMLPVLDTMARFPKTSAALITSFLLASRAVRTLQAGIKGLETLKATGELIRAFGNRVRNIPTRKMTRIEVNGAQSTRELQAYSNRLDRLPKTKTTTVSANTTQANRNVGAYERQAQRVPRRITTTATANTTAATTSISRVGSTAKAASLTSRLSFASIGTAAKTAGATISLAFRANPFGMILTGIQLAVAGFQLLYQHSAKFRRFVDGIANAAKSMAGKVGRWFGNMASSAGKHIGRMAQSAKRGWDNMNRTSQQSSQREARLQSQMAQRNQRSAQQMWARLRRSWSQGWQQNARVTQQNTRREIQQHQRMSTQINRLHSQLWAGLVRYATRGWNNNNRLTRKGVQQQVQQHRTMSTRIAVMNNQMWRRSQQAFTKGWTLLRNSTRQGTNNINTEFNRMRISVGQRAQQAMEDASKRFRKGYSDIRSDTAGWRGDMQNIWNDTRGKIGNIADKLRGESQDRFSDMHAKLNNITNNGLGQMHDAWHDKLESIAEVITSSGGHIHAQFVDLLHGLAKPFENLINGIKNGVNWILDHVGGDGKLGSFSFQAFAAGTNGPIEKDQLALLNDAPGPHYQEMVHRASTGQTFMLPAKRNMVFPLQKGDEVLDGERSAKLASTLQMPVPHAGGAIGNFFSGVFDKVGDAVDDATDWVDRALKNVVEFGTELFAHFVSSVTPKATDSINGGLKLNLPGFYARQLQAWIKKNLESMQDDNGDSITPEMIRKAAAKVHEHVTDAEIAQIINVANHESGNRSAGEENDWDSNAKAGTPSKGVLQFIQPTFDKYAVKGHHNIWKAFDQVLALLNDSNWRSDLHTGGWGPTGAPRGFANGGIATEPSVFGEAGAEMAIPLDTMKSTRAWQLMKQVVDYYAGNQPTTSATQQPADLEPLEKRLDAMMAQNQALIAAIDKLTNITDAVNNPTARYRRTQRDVNMANYQSFT